MGNVVLTNEEFYFFRNCYYKNFRALDQCHFGDCKNITSNNHVFSKNVLKYITNAHNKAFFLHYDIQQNDRSFRFREAGWDQVRFFPVSMRMLCNRHDSEIFKFFDNHHDGVDLSKEKHIKLLGYKAALHEASKMKSWMRIYKEIKNDAKYSYLYKKMAFEKREEVFTRESSAILDLAKHIEDFDSPFSMPYEHKEHNFSEKIEFYMCLYTRVPPTARSERARKMMQYEWPKNVFVNFFPQASSSILSIGACGSMDFSLESIEIFLESMNDGKYFENEDKKYLKYTSDLALMRSDTWCFSHKFYEEMIQPREKEIFERKKFYSHQENKTTPVGDFCLFW